MLEEKISKYLGVPYVYMPEQRVFLCQNGVAFTLEERNSGINLKEEYDKRTKGEVFYDYEYARNKGILRKKSPTVSTVEREQKTEKVAEESNEAFQKREVANAWLQFRDSNNRRITDTEKLRYDTSDRRNTNSSKSILVICLLLGFTSVISMYISTLHTATYLTDYTEIISAWLMSASVTAYNGTAFEVSVLFHTKKRNLMAIIFMFLWALVTLFSMATTVSVFYDQFNFQETQIALDNKQIDSNKLALELLQKKETDIRESIEFKKKDIEYRQEHDYATTSVRTELNQLQEDLQSNLSEQQKLLETTPEVMNTTIQRKESLFSFLGRLMHLEGGILEFIMSTLAAVFVNLISPLSLTAVIELLRKEK